MIDIKEESTEERILIAAEMVFMRDGYNGSRMQDIADKAGINKAMLHYYFRSKDKLFEHIFDLKSKLFSPKIEGLLAENQSFIELIQNFIEKYFELLIANPFLPLFIINTVNNPNRPDFLEKLPYQLNRKFAEKYLEDLANRKVKQINPLQFIISVMGMCIFPFMAKPMIKKAFEMDEVQFEKIMEARVEELKNYVEMILKP